MSNNSKINYNEALLIESYFKSQSTKKFYLNVMNNHTLNNDKFPNRYLRKDHGYAHIVVTYFSKSDESNFRDFEERQYYYITRLQKDNELQVRRDLIEIWGKESSNDVSILVINEKYNKVAAIPVKALISMKHSLGRTENLDFLWVYSLSENDLIWKVVPLCATEESTKALMAEWQFLGNVTYAKYRENTLVRVISYKNGNRSNIVDFKSIKQAYDTLHEAGFDMSYKTFQRRCNSEKPSLIETEKFTFYVTTKVDFEGPAALAA